MILGVLLSTPSPLPSNVHKPPHYQGTYKYLKLRYADEYGHDQPNDRGGYSLHGRVRSFHFEEEGEEVEVLEVGFEVSRKS